MNYGVTTIGDISHKSISLKDENRSTPILLKNNAGILEPGTLLQKVGVTTFVGAIAAAGIDASVTTIPLKGDSGVIADGSIIRINNEFIQIGTYNSGTHQFTGCTRAVWGSTAAAAVEDDVITVEVGATEQYAIYDGLKSIEGYLAGKTDTTSDAPVPAVLIFDDNVDRSSMTAKTGVPIPSGFDKNSLINFRG